MSRGAEATSVTLDFESVSTSGVTTGSGGSGAAPCPFDRQSGATGSSGTGPSSAHSGSHYMYTEVSGTGDGGHAACQSAGDLFDLSYDGSVCSDEGSMIFDISFMFHMYGTDIGTLRVTDAAGLQKWSLSGSQGTSWHLASVDVYSSSFRFEYARGSSYLGDAAIDQVVVNCGVVPPPPPTHDCAIRKCRRQSST